MSRLADDVRQGVLTQDEADLISAHNAGVERYENIGGDARRYLKVAQAYRREQLRELNGLPRPHHSRYNAAIIDAIAVRIGHSKRILDPMAGTLERLRTLERPDRGYHLVYGVEFEREWVEGYPHPRLVQGDARKLPYDDEFFDCIVVSPPYGNRDSDRTGEWWDNCDRKTYAGALGRNVSEGSLCTPFGTKYKVGHALAWAEAVRVLKADGLFVLNIKNHVADGQIVRVSQWHRDMLRALGLTEIDDTAIPTRGRPSGANAKVRAENAEKIYVYLRTAASLAKARKLKKAIKKGKYCG